MKSFLLSSLPRFQHIINTNHITRSTSGVCGRVLHKLSCWETNTLLQYDAKLSRFSLRLTSESAPLIISREHRMLTGARRLPFKRMNRSLQCCLDISKNVSIPAVSLSDIRCYLSLYPQLLKARVLLQVSTSSVLCKT